MTDRPHSTRLNDPDPWIAVAKARAERRSIAARWLLAFAAHLRAPSLDAAEPRWPQRPWPEAQ